MNDELTGKIALVTGGSRGIVRAATLALARTGADVAVNFQHREAEAQTACMEIVRIGRRALAEKADGTFTIHELGHGALAGAGEDDFTEPVT